VQYEAEEDSELAPPEGDVWVEEDEAAPARSKLPLGIAALAILGSVYLGGNEGLTMGAVVLTLIYMLIG
jgi:hypothetical protein